MRTRFLATDYSATTAGGGPFETLDFVRLPPPHLPPPGSFSTKFSKSFDEIPVFGISRETNKLPIDEALSIFLSDVIPHFIDGGGLVEPVIDNSKEKQEVIHAEEKDGTLSRDNGAGNGIKFVQFETPEMDISLFPPKSATHSQIECLGILSEILEAKCTMDQLNSELTLHDHLEIQRLVYSVDDVNVEYTMEEKTDLLEDDDSFQGELHSHGIKFPLFEVDEEGLGILGRIHMMGETLIFENIERQHVAQPDEVISNSKELLGSREFDLTKQLLHDSVAIQCLEDTTFASQLDHMSIIELSHCQGYSTYHHLGKPDGDSIWSMDLILLDEYLFFDLNPCLFYEMLSDSAKVIEVETRESLFGEAMNFRSFNELIVCHELTLMDDSFRALPVPIFSDNGNTNSFHIFVEELFTQLDWQSSSVSDSLYLDWHFLGEDDCEPSKYSSCWKKLWEIDTYDTNAAINSSDSGHLIFDFILSGGHSTDMNAEDYKEILNLYCNDVPISDSTGKADLSSLRNYGDGKNMNRDRFTKCGVDNASMFGETMSSDLEFFLNPRNYCTRRESIAAQKSVNTNTVCQVLTSSHDSAAPKSTTGVQQKWNVKMHQIWLSESILLLTDHLWKGFLAILENDKEFLHILDQYQASNDLKSLHIPNERLKRRLQEKIASSNYLACNDDDILVLTMLFAIKQMAFCLCYYGIQATYLYMDRLCTSLQCMKTRLSSLYNLIRDENQKAEKELSILHPSISVVQDILKTKLNSSNSKLLIVCDKVFWWPLKKLLVSLKISFNEPQYLFTPSCQQQLGFDITDAIVDVMLNSDCCLVSHEYISASFPFSKFGFILEYGGSNASSRISSICPKSDWLPTIYFLKVELEGSSIAEALCHGVDMPKSIKLAMKRELDSASAQKECKTKLEELLNTIPVKETYGELVEAEDCSTVPVKSIPVGLESMQNILGKPICAEAVIIVNTRNFTEEMIISRRSTYQRILEMEQQGAQVVERDIDLPVDIIISSAVCLTWYDCRNIGKKASAPDEAFSCLPLCVESIAASILTSLSFAFSCCILIFEGECNFLCSIMESSDELYAAAASLGIDLQLFCSYSSTTTEEIILSCINVAADLTGGLYPRMSDTESLAETFLTSFPSINPLAAHAILSSDALLGKFLELSNEGRIHSLQKYKVPHESIGLLSATSRYGEREDSKSGMTDCSSSVSVPDSENIRFKFGSESKKPRHAHNLYNASETPSEVFPVESLKLLPDNQLNLPKFSVSCNSWLSGSTEISNKIEQFSLPLDEKLRSQVCNKDANAMKKSIDNSCHYDFPLAKGLQLSADRDNSRMPRIDIDCGPRWKSATTPKNNFIRQNINATGVPPENFTGEVINVEDTSSFREGPYIANSSKFSLLDIEKDYSGTNSRTRKRPLTETKLHMFPSPDIDSASGAWVSTNDKRQAWKDEIKSHFDTTNRNNVSMASYTGLVDKGTIEKAPKNSYKLCFQEKSMRSFGGTPLSNALHSTQLQQGSPWTMEFLNRIKEKSRLRNRSLSYDLSSPCFDSSGDTSKFTKRKSPSILEFYKYKRGSTPQKIVEKKRVKRSSQSENSVKNKKVSVYGPSWTPVDKRARRTLSFSTNGCGGQSKLMWRDTAQRRL